jgi:hypothetical protein
VTLMANKISVIIEASVDQANRGLKSFRQSLADADTTSGKLKAGFGSAMDSVKANAGSLAMAGGAALVAFGVKAVGAFQDTALEAGRLADSLGLTSEQASRFMEVAGDLGIDTATLEKSIGKMNVEVAKSPAYFEKIGAAIAKNADGSTDVQQTFLNVVDAISKMPSATDRAAASQQLLGRGWRDMAELVNGGSAKLKASLDDVSDAKVIDASEVKKARDFRDAMDKLSDAAEDLALTAGEILVPALTAAADTTEKGRNAWNTLDDALGPVDESLGKLAATSYKYLNPVGQAITALGFFGDEADDATTATEAFETRMRLLQESSRDLADETDDLTGSTKAHTNAVRADMEAQQAANAAQIEAINSSLGYRNQVARTTEALRAATAVQQSATATDEERAQASRDAEGAVLEQAAAAVQLANDTASARGQTLTANAQTQVYVAELQRLAATLTGPAAAAIQGYIDQLGRIPRSIQTNIRGDIIGGSINGRRASGGPVSAGGAYLVGERGPELLQMGSTSGNVIPNNKLGAGGSGPTIVMNFGLATDPVKVGREVKKALDAFNRSGGR